MRFQFTGEEMNKMITYFVLCYFSIITAGCSSMGFGSKTTDGVKTQSVAEYKLDIPEWYKADSLVDEKNIIVTATDTSKDMQFAIDKAMMNARVELANRVSIQVNSVYRETLSEKGTSSMKDIDREVDRVSKIVTKQTLSLYKRDKLLILKDGDGYRAFVMLSIPIEEGRRLIQSNTRATREERLKEMERETGANQTGPTPISQLNVLEVDNEEYRKRRDAALQLPGAVYGRTTLQ
jgi:hypothetical protein